MSQSPLLAAMRRGLRLRCPRCGEGALLQRYIKVVSPCPACGEDNSRHRVDDAAPYFTILLVGHLVIAPMLAIQFLWDAPMGWVLGIAVPLVCAVTLAGLPFVKGTLLGVLSALDRRARAEATISPKAPPPAP
jgi:uncharacterized protein (DUF983 family)